MSCWCRDPQQRGMSGRREETMIEQQGRARATAAEAASALGWRSRRGEPARDAAAAGDHRSASVGAGSRRRGAGARRELAGGNLKVAVRRCFAVEVQARASGVRRCWRGDQCGWRWTSPPGKKNSVLLPLFFCFFFFSLSAKHPLSLSYCTSLHFLQTLFF